MNNVIVGEGKMFGKGVYAGKSFEKGEIVIQYNLKQLTDEDYNNLSDREKPFVHTHWAAKYLYSEPERYVNHSSQPNTFQDLKTRCDIALRYIKKGEQITTNASKDDI